MNIYYVTDQVLDGCSAETAHVDEICKNFAALGHAVRLYAPSNSVFHEPTGYRVTYISAAGPIFSLSFQFRLFFRLRKDIAASRPDTIYVRHSQLLFVPALIGRTKRIPLVLEVNGRLLRETKLADHSVIGRLLLACGVFRALDSFSSRRAARIISVAPAIKEDLMSDYKIPSRNIAVISNGVDTELFRPVPRKSDSDEIVIGYIGSFYQWQGLQHIIEASKSVIAERNARFRIYGRGADEEYMRAFVKAHQLGAAVEILPAVPHDEVPSLIDMFDICLSYPTRFRSGATSPFKMYEYLACGKAVISADIEGMRAEFGDAVTYAEPESPVLLAKAIVALIDDAARREDLGRKGRNFIEKEHSWRTVAGKIASLCAEAVAET